MRLYPLITLLALGCSGGEPVDSGDSAGGDTDTDTDTDTDPANLGFDVVGDFEGTTLSLTWLDASTLGTEDLAFGDVLLSTDVFAARVEVTAPTPDASELIEIDPEYAPGMMVAFYVPTLTRAGAYLGVGAVWPIHISGEIPADFVAHGAAAGWNALTPGADGQEFGDEMAVPLPVNLGQMLDITLGGTMASDPDGLRLVLLSGISLGGAGPDPLHDSHASTEWEIPVSGEPPADHFYELDFLEMEGALEIPFVYTDSDESGGYTSGDSLVNAACVSGTPVGLLWMPSPTDLTVAFGLVMQGGATGWNAILMGGPGGVLDEAARTSLVIDEGCVLGGP